MIAVTIRRLCLLSVIFGAALSVAPENSAKQMMKICCSVILICAILYPLSKMNINEYALELAKMREKEAELAQSGQEISERFNRLVIEAEYEAYIKDKAETMGLDLNAKVLARWSTEGIWVPYEVSLNIKKDNNLSQILVSELGIPEERQKWQT